MIFQWLAAPEWTRLVEALLHTLWQGVLIALGLGMILRHSDNPVWRYRCSLGALGGLLLAGVVTWAVLMHSSSLPTGVVTGSADLEASAPAPSRVSSKVPNVPPTAIIQVAPMASPGANRSWTAWLVIIWLLGATTMLGRAGVQVAGAERLRRSCRPLADPHINELFREARHALKLVRRVRLAVTDQLTSPAVAGVLVPTLILPLSLVTTLAPEQIRMVLLHELAHIRRGDYLANLFQLFTESLLFFNPAVWWLSRQIRLEREACCDATAIALGGAPAQYAQTLLYVAESALVMPPAAAPAFGGSREPSTLLERVRRMLVPGYRPALRLTWRAMLLAMVTGGGLLFLCAVGARTAVAAILSPQERIARIEEKMVEYGQKPGVPDFFPTNGAGPQVTLSGRVRTVDGSPLPKWVGLNAISALRRSTSGTYFSARKGRFTNSSPAGTIWLYAELENFAPSALGPLDGLTTNHFDNLELVLNRGFDVSLQLVDADTGAPVANAKVSSQFWIVNEGVPLHRWTTDTNGLVRLTHCADFPMTITVVAPGYEIMDRRFETLAAGQSLKIPLHSGAALTGTVFDKTTGQPLPGATIRILYEDTLTPFYYGWDDPLRVLAVTDPHGQFAARLLRAGANYWLGVSAPGHGSVILAQIPANSKNVTARLGPELVVHGRVLGSLDSLSHYKHQKFLYRSWSEAFQNNNYGNSAQVMVQTNAAGASFQFTNDVAGRVTLQAGDRSFAREVDTPVADWVIDLNSSNTAPVAVAGPPVPKRLVIFRFQDVSGAIPQGTVEVQIPDDLAPGHLTAHSVELEITNGEVQAEIPVGGQTMVRPKNLVGYWFKINYAGTVVRAGSTPLVISVTVVPAGAIFARARNADGTPAGGLMFDIEESKRSPLRDADSLLSDNSDGFSGNGPRQWASGPLPLDGTYQIVGWRGNAFCVSAPVQLTGARPDAEVTLKFPPGQSFSGEIRDAANQPGRNVAVSVEFVFAHQHSFDLPSVFTDDQGRFEVTDTTPGAGKYSVTVSVPGCRAEMWEVNFSQRPLRIRLQPGRILSGQVVEAATGQAILNARVSAWVSADPGRWPEQTTQTDVNGRFAFNTLADATYRVFVAGVNVSPNLDREFAVGQTNLLLKVTPYPGSLLKTGAESATAN